MAEIVPSLPAQSFQELKTKVAQVEGLVSRFQIDVADGLFTPARSWPMNPGDKASFERLVRGEERLPSLGALEYEVHFMAHSPEKLLPEWVRLGITRALFHVEARHDFEALQTIATRAHIDLGIVLNMGTSIERLAPYIADVAVVQLMGIHNIGVQGQPFDERVIDMVRATKARYPGVTIQVDGSVNEDTAPRLCEAGADILAPGSFVLSSKDPRAAIHALTHVELPQ